MTRKRRTTLPTTLDDGGGMQTKEDAGRPSFGDDDDIDPVVKTYDVFVSNALKDHIYLLQYPVQDWKQEYTEESAPLAIKMRPNEGDMEFEVPIDAHNYCPEQGEKFGAQGLNAPQDGLPMESQRLAGKPQPNQASYFVGRMRGDEMHLSPVRSVVQLRPNFHHYDATVVGKRKGDEGARAPRPVQLSMRNMEDSWDPRFPAAPKPPEDFVSLKFVDTLHPETVEIADKMLCTETSKEYASTMTGPEFLGHLLYTDHDGRDTHTVKVE